MKIFSSKKRVAAIGALTAITLVGGGAAVAYWTTTGSGTGSASTSAGTGLVTVSQLSTINAMYPGDVAQDLDVRVTNPNANNTYVASLGAYITTDKDTDCDGTNFLINGSSTGTDVSPTPLNWNPADIVNGTPVDSLNNTVQFNNKEAENQDLCKSANVTIHYVAE